MWHGFMSIHVATCLKLNEIVKLFGREIRGRDRKTYSLPEPIPPGIGIRSLGLPYLDA